MQQSMDRLDAMRAFAAVADRRSFVDAARRLRLSPAAVTRAVALLEDQLGLQLLHRTTRSVRLTERGGIYLESCRQILRDLDDAERRARGEDAAPRGTLFIAAPLTFGRLHVLPVVQAMLRAHRDLSIRLTLSDRIVHLAEEGIDVAVRIGVLADSVLTAVKVGEVRRVVVASPDYLAARGIPVAPGELGGHDLIASENLDGTNEWRFGRAEDIAVRIMSRLAVNSADAAVSAAAAGLGITRAISYQVHEAVVSGRLRLLLEEFRPPAMPVSLVTPARRIGSANVTAFVAAARAHLRALPLLAPGYSPPVSSPETGA